MHSTKPPQVKLKMSAVAKWSTDYVLGNAALDTVYSPTSMHLKKTYIPGKR
jgi:hypothetical protein